MSCINDGWSSSLVWYWRDAPANNPLSYTNWGPWAEGGNNLGPPTGTPTLPDTIPKTGTAEYSGLAFGKVLERPLFDAYSVEGTAKISVDFAATTVDTKIHFDAVDVTQVNGVLTWLPLDIAVTASLLGNAYSGEAGGGYQGDYQVPKASVSGQFFGPGAAETAGTFTYGTGNFLDLNIRGTFGAKLCGPGTPC